MIDIFNRLQALFHRLKTQMYFRPQFGDIGSNTTLFPPLFLSNIQFVYIGRGVLIRNGVRLEVLKPDSEVKPRLAIGDFTNIEQDVHIVCRSNIEIGTNVSLGARCVIVDVNHPYEDIHDSTKIGNRISAQDTPVRIGDGSFIGIGAVILPGVTIGRHCMIGANSVVSRDVPDFSVAVGVPARVIKHYDFERARWIRTNEEPELL